MIHSGIIPLDVHLGGVFPGRTHLLTGATGTGKTTAGLQFLNDGLQKGEPIALLTADRSDDLVAHAQSIGLELEPAVRSNQLLLLRYRSDFSNQLDWSGPASGVIDEFRRLLNDVQPTRVVVDPIAPFLSAGIASGNALSALSSFLEAIGTTTLVTHVGSIIEHHDARMDLLVQRAAAIIQLTRADDGQHRLQIVQSRPCSAPTEPITYVIRSGFGLALVDNAKSGVVKRVSRRSRASALREGAPS